MGADRREGRGCVCVFRSSDRVEEEVVVADPSSRGERREGLRERDQVVFGVWKFRG